MVVIVVVVGGAVFWRWKDKCHPRIRGGVGVGGVAKGCRRRLRGNDVLHDDRGRGLCRNG